MQERVRGPPARGSGRVWLCKGEDAEMRISSAVLPPKRPIPPRPHTHLHNTGSGLWPPTGGGGRRVQGSSSFEMNGVSIGTGISSLYNPDVADADWLLLDFPKGSEVDLMGWVLKRLILGCGGLLGSCFPTLHPVLQPGSLAAVSKHKTVLLVQVTTSLSPIPEASKSAIVTKHFNVRVSVHA